MVRCCDNSIYTGITNNLEKRLLKHNSGKGAKYTRSRIPVVLVWHKYVGSKSEALKLEASIKKLSKISKENMICSLIINGG